MLRIRQLAYYSLVIIAFVLSSCAGQNNFKARNTELGYAAQIDTSKTAISQNDSIQDHKKLIHTRLDNFYKKMTKKNNTMGYGFSYMNWIVIIGGIVLSLWLAVNGVI